MAVFRDHNLTPVNHDRSVEDRRRHKQLVEKSIKENLADILSEESIIGQSKDKKIKIPIRGLKEYQFVYGKNPSGVVTGDGTQKRGQILGKEQPGGKDPNSKTAGNDEGEDLYETEITLEEALNYLLEDLELPDMDKKKFLEVINQNSFKKSGYQRHGINPRLAKKKTMVEKIKRQQNRARILKEKPEEREPFKQEDLRYHRLKKTIKKESNAVIICIMDVSGSMDSTKKYLARSFFFILSQFIKSKYNSVEVAFVSHTTTAKEVNEVEFFHKGESGGTYISSGFNKALEIIEKRYNPVFWNIYVFYAGDGDNWSEDNEKAFSEAKKLAEISNMFAYTELMKSYYTDTIKNKLIKEVTNKNFTCFSINEKGDLWKAIKLLLRKEQVR